MATKNLNLPQFDGSDYISVDPFNDAFSKIDKLGTDYVEESGKVDRKSTRLNSSHMSESRMPSSA